MLYRRAVDEKVHVRKAAVQVCVGGVCVWVCGCVWVWVCVGVGVGVGVCVCLCVCV